MPDQAKAFAASQTRENLMRAFAGESQARSRYTIAAGIAHKSGLAVIQGLFLFTAEQEKTHAKQFYRQLHDLSGQTVRVDGTYPVDIYPSALEHLRAAQHNEHEEHGSVYPSFAAIATQEGFPEAAASFRQIAAIEQLHGERFGLLADQLESGALFVSQIETGWMCLNCGHTQNSLEAPKQCPVCNHGQGWFIRLELAPWSPVVKQT